MREISLQMVNRNISSFWWKKLVEHFVQVGNQVEIICSAHYGTEIYLIGPSDEDVAFFQLVMKEFTEEDFSVRIDR